MGVFTTDKVSQKAHVTGSYKGRHEHAATAASLVHLAQLQAVQAMVLLNSNYGL